jgi:hypothetical protein
LRFPCGSLAPAVREPLQAGAVDITEAFALLAELDLHDVEELDRAWFEAELRAALPVA